MPDLQAAPTASRRTRSLVLVALVATGAVLLTAAAAAPAGVRGAGVAAARQVVSAATPARAATAGRERPAVQHGHRQSGPLGQADGKVPEDLTVFDDNVPAVGRLNAALKAALRTAATDAAAHGVSLRVNSGWRSAAYQQQLLLAATAKYGSLKEASRWVATPQASAHVSGNAIDIGPPKAAAWLSAHGPEYDLCQIYRNETWHFELRAGADERGCPALYADPAHDPRMQQ